MRLIRRGYGEGAAHWLVTRGYASGEVVAHVHLCLSAARTADGKSAARSRGRANRRLSATRAC